MWVVPFRMLRERIPMLSAMTLDQLGAKMRTASARSDITPQIRATRPASFEGFRCPGPRRNRNEKIITRGWHGPQARMSDFCSSSSPMTSVIDIAAELGRTVRAVSARAYALRIALGRARFRVKTKMTASLSAGGQ